MFAVGSNLIAKFKNLHVVNISPSLLLLFPQQTIIVALSVLSKNLHHCLSLSLALVKDLLLLLKCRLSCCSADDLASVNG